MKKENVNPLLPTYEYIPDCEPQVFGDRLYLFGSHDCFGGDIRTTSPASWQTAAGSFEMTEERNYGFGAVDGFFFYTHYFGGNLYAQIRSRTGGRG